MPAEKLVLSSPNGDVFHLTVTNRGDLKVTREAASVEEPIVEDTEDEDED